MKVNWSVLLIVCVSLQAVDCSLPDFTPTRPSHQVGISVKSSVVSSMITARFRRLPGLCQRLRRRRVTVLCNLVKFCWSGLNQTDRSGQVCRCPRGSRCSHFYIHSL
ncbi:hypothetical protein EXN66_Car000083 [Channa argus]|uniref:Cocaine- and amphetamine-regulated transcript protein n=1 Tax=Channa argus TaxID=215402 RepID=A0A6G1QWB5_CHAAH|nr:hypothetical protein EXN66_Car000083 [Channa argus]